MRPSDKKIGPNDLDNVLDDLGRDGRTVRLLVAAVDEELRSLVALSSLTSPLALDYLDRLARPVPELTPSMGVEIVTRSYAAHLAVERDPGKFGAADVPVLGTLPGLRRGAPPQDLLSRAVKASRRGFEAICALSGPVWNGFVYGLVQRAHERAPADERLLAIEVVDGLARFGWVLRQVDIHYGQSPERRSAP